jgi:hypothetical protein
VLPRGILQLDEAALFSTRLDDCFCRASFGLGVKVFTRPRSEGQDYAVILNQNKVLKTTNSRGESPFTLSPLNRFIYVNDVDSIGEAVRSVSHFTGKIATIGVAGDFCVNYNTALEGLRPHRICKVGEMQKPPIYSHHDGQHPLSDLVDWIDIET